MGAGSCTSPDVRQSLSEIPVDQKEANTMFCTQYNLAPPLNAKNAKKQAIVKFHSSNTITASKALSFEFGNSESTQYSEINDGREVIDLNAQRQSKNSNRLEPIVFSIIDFQVFTDEQNEKPETKLSISSQRIEKPLASTKDVEDNCIPINQTALEYILSQVEAVPSIDVSKEQFIRIKKQNIQNDYKFEEKIGEGSFGEVFKCIHKKTSQVRAAKILKRNVFTNPKLKEQFLQQSKILKRLDHPNVLKIFEIYQKNNTLCIISQFCSGNSLSSYLKEKISFSYETKKEILRQILLGVNYLHQKNIIHRDLKPQNIVFITSIDSTAAPKDVDLRIIDFGLAVESNGSPFKEWANIGTFNFMAPEVFEGIYSYKCDSWSCGVIAYLLLMNLNPFKGFNLEEVKDNIKHYYPNIDNFKDVELSAAHMILNLTKINYVMRWDIKQALSSSYFTEDRSQPVSSCVLDRLSNYSKSNGFVSAVQSYLVFKKITQTQQAILKKYFYLINLSNNGVINLQQFRNINPQNKQLIETTFNKMDKDRSGTIDFSQFLSMMVSRRELFTRQNIEDVYDFIDLNKDGRITSEQIKYFLRFFDKKAISNLIQQISGQGKNYSTLQEFTDYLQKERWM